MLVTAAIGAFMVLTEGGVRCCMERVAGAAYEASPECYQVTNIDRGLLPGSYHMHSSHHMWVRKCLSVYMTVYRDDAARVGDGWVAAG